jgi:hypothetical protein
MSLAAGRHAPMSHDANAAARSSLVCAWDDAASIVVRWSVFARPLGDGRRETGDDSCSNDRVRPQHAWLVAATENDQQLGCGSPTAEPGIVTDGGVAAGAAAAATGVEPRWRSWSCLCGRRTSHRKAFVVYHQPICVRRRGAGVPRLRSAAWRERAVDVYPLSKLRLHAGQKRTSSKYVMQASAV